jgi:YaaC-like Protein
MPRVAVPREGETLTVKKRPLPFSYFPVTRGKRRAGLFDLLFAGRPWTVMRGAINDQTSGGHRDEALAFLGQAEDFYQSATGRLSANPLMTYYAFLNLGKALLRVLGFGGDLSKAQHGLSERHIGTGADLSDFAVEVKPAFSGWTNVYAELVDRLGFSRPAVGTQYPIIELISQVVVGHRLWREASHRTERFVPLEEIQILDDKAAKELWLRLYVSRGDLDRYRITHKRLLAEGDLASDFKEVEIGLTGENLEWVCFEQQGGVAYTGRPTDVLMDVVEPMRPRLWRIITAGPEQGYRKYYMHLTPAAEHHRLPQIASLWVLMYYFGSVVRYRPHEFDTIAAGRYGAFVSEFISAQSEQLLYILASEMCRREVAKPAVI